MHNIKYLSKRTKYLSKRTKYLSKCTKGFSCKCFANTVTEQYLEERLVLHPKLCQSQGIFVADKDVDNDDYSDGNDDDMLDGGRGLKFQSVVMSPGSFSCFSDSVRELPEICTGFQTFIFTQYRSSSSSSSSVMLLKLNRSKLKVSTV